MPVSSSARATSRSMPGLAIRAALASGRPGRAAKYTCRMDQNRGHYTPSNRRRRRSPLKKACQRSPTRSSRPRTHGEALRVECRHRAAVSGVTGAAGCASNQPTRQSSAPGNDTSAASGVGEGNGHVQPLGAARYMASTSATVRAIGPTAPITENGRRGRPAGDRLTVPAGRGLRPQDAVKCAGTGIEPPPSLPMPPAEHPAAIAAAPPLKDHRACGRGPTDCGCRPVQRVRCLHHPSASRRRWWCRGQSRRPRGAGRPPRRRGPDPDVPPTHCRSRSALDLDGALPRDRHAAQWAPRLAAGGAIVLRPRRRQRAAGIEVHEGVRRDHLDPAPGAPQRHRPAKHLAGGTRRGNPPRRPCPRLRHQGVSIASGAPVEHGGADSHAERPAKGADGN